ncbi:MAG TPA: uracil-DNA glycosylase [Planctomycetaceae bacterium]|nr:uracil-DNA glycosylase [Planctomycetaceae bacterium]HRF01840.1 uracil-DNA glycosylase [Pirellulaceae bacterium]
MDLSGLSDDWRAVLEPLLSDAAGQSLRRFVAEERERHQVFPAEASVFRALAEVPLSQVCCVILGQDPYHDVGQAQGLAFSVPDRTATPPSLRNILRERQDDLGAAASSRSNDLGDWARQGVLLLNTVLTVRAHEPLSHRRQGWERITDALIDAVAARSEPTAFVLWGKPAQAKGPRIPRPPHFVLESAHPSPLSARRGFFGSRPFSTVNRFLEEHGRPPIAW